MRAADVLWIEESAFQICSTLGTRAALEGGGPPKRVSLPQSFVDQQWHCALLVGRHLGKARLDVDAENRAEVGAG